jgi:pimeloyl-ACP methyl ester carboxylesterase
VLAGADAFREAGWDTFRLNRRSSADTLPESAAALAGEAEALKRKGYRRVVLAGQSFGAFISLIAAGHSDAVDGVIGTAPAAYGSARSNPLGYGLNATRLYDLLGAVRRARVALFFFEGDIFDPGGRAPIADEILGARGLRIRDQHRLQGISSALQRSVWRWRKFPPDQGAARCARRRLDW